MNPPSSDSVSTGEVTVASLHVVRRYGPVGGMERYVWELTRALVQAGHPVTVICERLHAPAPAGIDVHELGEVAPRPRRLAPGLPEAGRLPALRRPGLRPRPRGDLPTGPREHCRQLPA